MKLCFLRKVSGSTTMNCDPLLDTNSSGLHSVGKGGQESNYSSKCYLWRKCCFWPFIEAISQHDDKAEVNGAWTNRYLISVANLPHNESHKGTGCSGDAKPCCFARRLMIGVLKLLFCSDNSLMWIVIQMEKWSLYVCKFSRIIHHWPTWTTAFWCGRATE